MNTDALGFERGSLVPDSVFVDVAADDQVGRAQLVKHVGCIYPAAKEFFANKFWIVVDDSSDMCAALFNRRANIFSVLTTPEDQDRLAFE